MKQSTSQHHPQGGSRHYNNQRVPYNSTANNSTNNGVAPAQPAVPPIQLQPAPQPQQPHANSYHRNNSNHQYMATDMPPVETVVARLETACSLLHGIGMNNTKVAEISSEILILSEDLRRVGPHLELSYPDILDRVMSSMRDASAQPCLPPHLRLAIFELVELRASKWLLPSDSSNYYRQRRTGQEEDEASEHSHVSHPKSVPASNAAASTEKPDSKTYREEILIKNSDSGKVMGVRGRRVHIIEALSDTIISFEKVGSSAKERVLSINGYSQQSINMAKALIHDTINRNASPIFDQSASATLAEKGAAAAAAGGAPGEEDSSGSIASEANGAVGHAVNGTTVCQFNYTVAVNDEIIKVSGNNFQLVQEAKLALDDYFACKYNLYPGIVLDEIESSAKEEDPPEVLTPIKEVPAPNSPVITEIVTPKPITPSAIVRKKYARDELLAICRNVVKSGAKPDFSGLDQSIRDLIVRKSSSTRSKNHSQSSSHQQSPTSGSSKKSL